MKDLKIISILLFCLIFSSIFIPHAHSAESGANISQDQLAHAQSLARQGDVDEAIEQYLIYYAEYPGKHSVLQSISDLYKRDKRFEEAIKYAEKFLLSGDKFLIRGAHFQDQCDRLFDSWKKTGAGKVRGLLGKADGIELAREHYLAILEDANAKPRMIIIAKLMLGDIESASKDDAEARKYYLSAFDLISPPEDEWQKAVNNVLFHRFINKQNHDDALTIYKNHPSYDYLTQLGDWLKRQGRGFEMIELYEDYIFSSDVNFDNFYAFGLDDYGLACNVLGELVQVGQDNQLMETFAILAADFKANSRLYRNYAYLLFKMGRYEESLQQIENYLSVLSPPTVTDYRLAGDLCDKGGMINEAIGYYEMARNTEVTDHESRRESMTSQIVDISGYWKTRFKIHTLETLGNLYMKTNSLSDAEACFKEIVELQSGRNDGNAQANLAKICELTGKENTFVEELKSKVANDPWDTELRVEYGQTLSKAGKLSQAVEQFAKAVELSGENLSVRLKFADALAKNKQNSKAIAEYKKVLYVGLTKGNDEFRRGKGGDETNPWSVLHRLANFCQRAGEKDKLLEIYYQALELLDSPETKWKPDEYMTKRILRDITEILDAKGEYNSIIELWLDYHKEMGHYARYVIKDRIRYVDSEPLVKQLHELTMADPNDRWGWFILADMWAAENRDEQAIKIYSRLLEEVPSGSRIHHDLADVFQRMNRYDLIVEACKKELDRLGEGSRDYGRGSGRIAETHLKLGDKEKAAEFYRKAISCDASETEHQQYQRGLYKATDGKEGVGKVDIGNVGPVEDLNAMRLQAESLLRNKGNYTGAIELYDLILEKAPTDIESMVRLGEAYQMLGNIAKATAIFEQVAFDKDIRIWVHAGSYYGADSCLESIYRQEKDIKKQVKLFALTSRGNFSEIKHRLKTTEEFEEFHKCLIDQFEQTPKNIKLRLYMAQHFFERGDISKANSILKELRADLTDDKGVAADRWNAIRLANAYEKLGRFDEALAVLPIADYENYPDRNDRMGELRMRLYAKVGQFEKTLEICRLRLKKNPKGHNIIKVAEQLGQATRYHVDGNRLISSFLQNIKEEMSTHNYRRFCGAVKSYLASHPADKATKDNASDIISLLKDGRKVETPKNCRGFADFLEQLAYQADTVATQSFMGRYGQRRKAPRVGIESGSAFEVLAEAIDGTNIPFEITQDGYWAFFESGDESKRFNYAAVGGLFCKLQKLIRSANNERLYLGGRVSFAPEVKSNIASIQSTFTVVEAIDNRGRNVPVPEVPTRWDGSTQKEIPLGKQHPPAKSIKMLRVKTQVAIGTKWVTFKVDRMDHDKPIIVEKDGVRIQIEPIREIKYGSKACWGIPIDIQRKNIKLKARLNDEIYFITRDGVELRTSRNDLSNGTIQLRPDIGTFDPATTSLFIREPAVIEIVPFELTFKDIPIIER